MEIWDAYNADFEAIDGMTLVRGEEASIPNGVYHLVGHVLVRHTDGTYLLMQRDPRKSHPGMWEATAGGSALKGETPLECAMRELHEETGIEASDLQKIRWYVKDKTRSFYAEYLCVTDCDKDSVRLQEGETVDYKWITADEIRNMPSDELLSREMRDYIINQGMKLVFPTMKYKDKAIEYINEFYEYGSKINGGGGLDRCLKEATYEEWLEKTLRYLDIANPPKDRSSAITYFYVREADDRIVGMVNMRLALTDFMRKEGGHIGYSIRPTERRKHYGTALLERVLKVYGAMGIREVLVSCDKENTASAGVIKNCGGVLKDEFFSETYKEMLQMYRIRR